MVFVAVLLSFVSLVFLLIAVRKLKSDYLAAAKRLDSVEVDVLKLKGDN